MDPTNEFKIKEGPSLNKRRAQHGCAKMTVNGRTILVVAGGLNLGGSDYWDPLGNFVLNSVEILDPLGNNVWTQGMFLKFLKFITVKLCWINIFQMN